MTWSIASRFGSNIRVNSRTVEWLWLYWFCYNIGTDASAIAARSALLKRMFPFFVIGRILGLSFNVGRYLAYHLQDMLLHSGSLGLAHCLLNLELLTFGSVSTEDCEFM
jgi:hypothetical protein